MSLNNLQIIYFNVFNSVNLLKQLLTLNGQKEEVFVVATLSLLSLGGLNIDCSLSGSSLYL